jgi:hypothetical protein
MSAVVNALCVMEGMQDIDINTGTQDGKEGERWRQGQIEGGK